MFVFDQSGKGPGLRGAILSGTGHFGYHMGTAARDQ